MPPESRLILYAAGKPVNWVAGAAIAVLWLLLAALGIGWLWQFIKK